MSRELIFRDSDGAEYQPVRHHNRRTGNSAFRVKPPGASNETDDCLELDSIEETAKAMLVDMLPARVKALAGGPVNYLKFGAQKLVSYELDPEIAERITRAQADALHAAACSHPLAHEDATNILVYRRDRIVARQMRAK